MSQSRTEAIAHAKRLYQEAPGVVKILDLETAGLRGSPEPEILEIGIQALDGSFTFRSLFRADLPIHPKATEVHGYSNEDLQGFPHFRDKRALILEVLRDSHLVIFNKGFDVPVLKANMEGIQIPVKGITCAMSLYMSYLGSARRVPLPHVPQCGKAHSALADTCSTAYLIKQISEGDSQEKREIALAPEDLLDLNF